MPTSPSWSPFVGADQHQQKVDDRFGQVLAPTSAGLIMDISLMEQRGRLRRLVVREWRLTTGDDHLTATLFRHFTHLALPSDQTPPDGSTDRRGWWANVYEDRPYGSLLWTLERSKIVGTAAVALRAQQYATSRFNGLWMTGSSLR